MQTHVTIADVQQRQSAGPSAQIMNQIIDAVVLRGFTGARIAADNSRTVNGNRQFGLQRVYVQLGQILRLFLMIAKTLYVAPLGFHNQAFALTSDITSRDVMITP